MNYQARKEAKVTGQNEVNRLAMQLAAILLPIMKGWEGEKILLTSGHTSKKFDESMPAFEAAGFRWYVSTAHGYAVWLKCDFFATVKGESGGFYATQSIYLADVSNGVLTKAREDTVLALRTDLTVEECERVKQQIRQLEGEISKLKHSVAPFGEGLHGN